MNPGQLISTEQSGPSTSAGARGLRHPGLVMGKGGKNEAKALGISGLPLRLAEGHAVRHHH